MHYEKGKGYIDVAGNKVCSKREMQLRLARIAGYENDSSTFTRLRIESRVAYPPSTRSMAQWRNCKGKWS